MNLFPPPSIQKKNLKKMSSNIVIVRASRQVLIYLMLKNSSVVLFSLLLDEESIAFVQNYSCLTFYVPISPNKGFFEVGLSVCKQDSLREQSCTVREEPQDEQPWVTGKWSKATLSCQQRDYILA